MTRLICCVGAALLYVLTLPSPAPAQESALAKIAAFVTRVAPASVWLPDEIVVKAIERIGTGDRDIPELYEKYVRVAIVVNDPRREQVLIGGTGALDAAHQKKAETINHAQRMLIAAGIEFVKDPDNLDVIWLSRREIIVNTIVKLPPKHRDRIMVQVSDLMRGIGAVLTNACGTRTSGCARELRLDPRYLSLARDIHTIGDAPLLTRVRDISEHFRTLVHAEIK